MPPSDATSQYPWPVGEAAIPTIGWFRRTFPAEPWLETRPVLLTVQNPSRPYHAGGALGLLTSSRRDRPPLSVVPERAWTRSHGGFPRHDRGKLAEIRRAPSQARS